MESRSNRKRSLGRMTKHLGDLSLQAGLFTDALTHYQTAADILRSINDWLWLAGNLPHFLCHLYSSVAHFALLNIKLSNN